MNVMNSADFRDNLADVLETVNRKKQAVIVSRFGQPKAVLMDVFTYNWQKQIITLLKNIHKLTASEIETLNILLDDKTRNALLTGLSEIEKGGTVSFDEFQKD